jgi:hypothetical protein
MQASVGARTVGAKLLTGVREQRARIHLLRSVPDLDRQYLAHWTERLGLGALYREALGD